MSDRTLPHNLEAEKCVLGAILIDNPSFNQAAEVIDSAIFSATRTGASSKRWSGCPSAASRSIRSR